MVDQLKIAIVEPVGGHGGMDLYSYGLANGLSKNDIHVYYYTCEETTIKEYKNVITYKTFIKVWSTKNKFLRLFYFLRGYFRSAKQAKKEKCKILHLHFFDLNFLNFLVLILLKLFGLKIFVTIHDVESFVRRPHPILEKSSLKMIDQVILHNETCKKELVDKGYRLPPIAIIPHGNYLPFIENPLKDLEFQKTFELLFFGQIKKVKGLETLLEAISILSKEGMNVNLTIAGKPWKTEPDHYLKLIDQLNIKERVKADLKFIPNDKVHQYFEKANLVVLPYQRIYQSGVLLLSMSYGRPILTSNLDAFKEIIKDSKNGFLFKRNDPNDLASKIKAIAGNQELLRDVTRNAQILIKNEFDWEKIGEMTKTVYLQRL